MACIGTPLPLSYPSVLLVYKTLKLRGKNLVTFWLYSPNVQEEYTLHMFEEEAPRNNHSQVGIKS
jgi:hypothetical protein